MTLRGPGWYARTGVTYLSRESWLRLGSGELLTDHNTSEGKTDESPGRKASLGLGGDSGRIHYSLASAVAGDEEGPGQGLRGLPVRPARRRSTTACTRIFAMPSWWPTQTATSDTTRDVPSRSLTDEAHKAGVKVLLSLGGWGWDKQFASIVSKPEAEDRYAKAVMAIIDTFDYDGIDLDWEYPDTKEEVVGFDRLARRFRKELDEISRKKHRPMVLTMAASSNAETLRWLSKEILIETHRLGQRDDLRLRRPLDVVRGPQRAALRLIEAARRQASLHRAVDEVSGRGAGIPADRLAVGIPLYGRGFAVPKPYASTKERARRASPARRQLQQPPRGSSRKAGPAAGTTRPRPPG